MDIQEQYRGVYRHLVLATAWQETCWRQFIRKGGKATYIKSAVGSTGLMQINEHVWRGFYDLRGLRWDIHYNARAGTEILMHYLKDYVIAHAQEGSSKMGDFLARATYQVYNGGPGNLARFVAQKIPKAVRRIDDLFWAKYQAICSDQNRELVHCLTGR
jgi:soluble lytic murein transglycosylase-like protein